MYILNLLNETVNMAQTTLHYILAGYVQRCKCSDGDYRLPSVGKYVKCNVNIILGKMPMTWSRADVDNKSPPSENIAAA